ncbi:MAG: hypothetical protein V9F04_13890 [Dermatophilaceae bacterium]
MDVDLSTDLAALLPLVAPLLSGHSDLAIGTPARPRLARRARPQARAHLALATTCCCAPRCATRFSDAQCGFKAIRADRARELLPLVEDTGWFFDTELLVLAERAGLRIHEVPVDWVDDPDSRVDIVATATRRPARASWRLARGMATRPDPGRPALPAPGRADVPPRLGSPARAVRRDRRRVDRSPTSRSSCCCAAPLGAQWRERGGAAAHGRRATPRANRRLTFGVRGAADRFRHQLQGLVVLRHRPRPHVGVARRCSARSPPTRSRAGSRSPCSSPRTSPRRSSASCSSASWVFPRHATAPPCPHTPDRRTTA